MRRFRESRENSASHSRSLTGADQRNLTADIWAPAAPRDAENIIDPRSTCGQFCLKIITVKKSPNVKSKNYFSFFLSKTDYNSSPVKIIISYHLYMRYKKVYKII